MVNECLHDYVSLDASVCDNQCELGTAIGLIMCIKMWGVYGHLLFDECTIKCDKFCPEIVRIFSYVMEMWKIVPNVSSYLHIFCRYRCSVSSTKNKTLCVTHTILWARKLYPAIVFCVCRKCTICTQSK